MATIQSIFGSAIWAEALISKLRTFILADWEIWRKRFDNVRKGDYESLIALIEHVSIEPVPEEFILFDWIVSTRPCLHKLAMTITCFNYTVNDDDKYDAFVVENFHKLFFTTTLKNFFGCEWYVDEFGNTVRGVCYAKVNITGDPSPVCFPPNHPFIRMIDKYDNDGCLFGDVRGRIDHLGVRRAISVSMTNRTSVSTEWFTYLTAMVQRTHGFSSGVARLVTIDEWDRIVLARLSSKGSAAPLRKRPNLLQADEEENDGVAQDITMSFKLWGSTTKSKRARVNIEEGRSEESSYSTDTEEIESQ